MTLNHLTKQWAQFAVLSMMLVGGPVTARAEETAGAKAPQNAEAQRTGPGCLPLEADSGTTFRELKPHTYEVVPSPGKGEAPCTTPMARIVPSFRDGVARGFKLFAIRPESVYARAGLKNGDVVLSINDMPLSSPEKALEAYAKMKEAPRVEAEVEREGKRIRFTYLVRRDAKR